MAGFFPTGGGALGEGPLLSLDEVAVDIDILIRKICLPGSDILVTLPGRTRQRISLSGSANQITLPGNAENHCDLEDA